MSSQQADQFIIENDGTNSYAEAESELSLDPDHSCTK